MPLLRCVWETLLTTAISHPMIHTSAPRMSRSNYSGGNLPCLRRDKQRDLRVGCGAGANNNAPPAQTLVTIGNTVVPDLQITNVNVPTSAFAGETITMQWTGINAGTFRYPIRPGMMLSTSRPMRLSMQAIRALLFGLFRALAVSATYSAQRR